MTYLDTELLEERWRNNRGARDKGVRIQQRAPDNTYEDDAEPSSENGRAIPNNRAPTHRPQIRYNLRNRHLVRAKVILIRQHCRIQILTSVGHEVEPGHEQHHVDEEQPVSLQRDLSFLQEGLCRVGRRFADTLALLVCLRFGETETEEDD